MTQPTKIERTINEFCANGYLENFKQVIVAIFKEINTENCQISARYDENKSSHIFSGEKCRIQITLQNVYEEPIEVIWTILHEFGHHLSGKADKYRKHDFLYTIEREKLAWKLARFKAIAHPLLLKQIDSFDRYSEKCIESYTIRKYV